MRKLKFLLVIMLACVFILPFNVFAEGESENNNEETNEVSENTEDSKKVNLYLFRGEGCSHCAEFEAWLEEIDEEYGKYYKLVDYETWYNEENAELMQRVGEARGEEVEGVPYIIIGNHSWNGFADDYKAEILDAIKDEYEKEVSKRYDIMKLIDSGKIGKDEKSTSSDVVSLILIIIITGGIVFGIVQARKQTN